MYHLSFTVFNLDTKVLQKLNKSDIHLTKKLLVMKVTDDQYTFNEQFL